MRKILESLQQQGPLSRADLTRETGISAPTVSKAVSDLLEQGLLEEGDAPENAVGRPGKRLHLAKGGSSVVGVVLDRDLCRVLPASLDGVTDEAATISFNTPAHYGTLIEQISQAVDSVVQNADAPPLGIGISIPGLHDSATQRCLVSPNLPITNNKTPAADLSALTGLPTVGEQESRALCLAEGLYGDARGLDDFVVLDMSTGLGMGVVTEGKLLTGHLGIAGELGHVTVDPSGRLCGCGNHGCLETLATDSALAYLVSERIGQNRSVSQVIEGLRNGHLQATEELNKVCEYLAIALAAVVNLFNPATIFVHSRMLAIDDSIMDKLQRLTQRRALKPSFEGCTIRECAVTKQQGAVAAIVQHLTQSVGPRLST